MGIEKPKVETVPLPSNEQQSTVGQTVLRVVVEHAAAPVRDLLDTDCFNASMASGDPRVVDDPQPGSYLPYYYDF